MKKSPPIDIGCMQFYAYGRSEKVDQTFTDTKIFDNRQDIAVDSDFGGIAIKVSINSLHFDKGVRRLLAFVLVDMTSRCEVATHREKVIIHKEELFKDIYVDFPAEVHELKAGHSYRLVATDEGSSRQLSRRVFHLYDLENLDAPWDWYLVPSGGIRLPWDDTLYKSLDAREGQYYYVRFNIEHTFGDNPPKIMPELEIRLFHPDGKKVEIDFLEPRCESLENYEDSRWYVEFPFDSTSDNKGVFYAELLCMEHPIAGFVFDTAGLDIQGRWLWADIQPLDEYSLAMAKARIDQQLPERKVAHETDELTEMINDFIKKELADKSESNDSEDSGADDLPSVSSDYDDAAQEKELEDETLEMQEPEFSLDMLTGLQSVKSKLKVYEQVMLFNKKRSSMGLPTASLPLHSMFLGSPGTGKTTIAKYIGEMLHKVGVLSKGHVVIKERATLLGQNYNSESEKTLEALEQAQGGILFIDEAYQLYQPNDPRDPGKFVIETLLTALADDSRRDWMLILAGYPKEMKRMFEMNPGFKSRIPDSNIYIFEDFTETELMEIAENYLTRHHFTVSSDAREALIARLNHDYTVRDKSFGNARHVVNMIQTEIIPSMAVRIISTDINDVEGLSEIKACDIPMSAKPIKPTRPRLGFIP